MTLPDPENQGTGRPTLDSLFEDLLNHEGGFSTDPADRAHYGRRQPPARPWDCTCTNMGVTQATLSNYYGRQASVEEVRGLSRDLAREIYERQYLAGPRIDTLPALLIPLMFDTSVHSGARRAVMLLQQVLNAAGFGPLQIDGAVGPRTRTAAVQAAAAMGPWLVNACVEQRRQFLEGLIAGDPTQERFRRGWMTRIASFKQEIPGEAADAVRTA
jgi:lysozyme family protein